MIITRGTARIEERRPDGSCVCVSKLFPDDLFGESCFSQGIATTGSLIADEHDVEILKLEKEVLDRVFEQDLQLCNNFLLYLAAVAEHRSEQRSKLFPAAPPRERTQSPIRAAISPVHQAAAEEMRGAAQLLVEQPKVQKLLARRAVLESRDSNLPNNNNNMSAANKTALYKKKPSLQEDWRPNSPDITRRMALKVPAQAPNPQLSWEGVTNEGRHYERKMSKACRQLMHNVDAMFELVTPYQLKDLQSRVAREKPPIAMPLLQSLCIIIEYQTPQNWNDLNQLLMKPNALRKRMSRPREDQLEKTVLASLRRLVRRMQSLDFYQVRSINSVANWIEAYEKLASYRVDHLEKNQTFRQKFSEEKIHTDIVKARTVVA